MDVDIPKEPLNSMTNGDSSEAKLSVPLVISVKDVTDVAVHYDRMPPASGVFALGQFTSDRLHGGNSGTNGNI